MTGVRALLRDIQINYVLYLFVLPAVVLILLFNYFPMYGVQIAFRDFKPADGILGSDWAGLKYFERFFHSYQFKDLFANTLGISVYLIAVSFPVPVIIALVFNQIQRKRFRSFMQTVSYAPHFISIVVVVSMLQIFLSPSTGLVNHILGMFGYEAVNFMGEPAYYKTIYVLSDVWQHMGWDSIIYIAALSSIDTQLYDAADVDGASAWQKIVSIEIPSLLPTMVVLLILKAGSIIGVGFEKAYLMQNSLNIGSSEVIETYVYKVGLNSLQYSYSAAIGIFTNVINFIVLVVVNQIAKKAGNSSLW